MAPCELGKGKAMCFDEPESHLHPALLVRPDPQKLESWLERYRGIGQIRSEGYESHIFRSSDNP